MLTGSLQFPLRTPLHRVHYRGIISETYFSHKPLRDDRYGHGTGTIGCASKKHFFSIFLMPILTLSSPILFTFRKNRKHIGKSSFPVPHQYVSSRLKSQVVSSLKSSQGSRRLKYYYILFSDYLLFSMQR